MKLKERKTKREILENYLALEKNLQAKYENYEKIRVIATNTAAKIIEGDISHSDSKDNKTERKFVDCAAALEDFSKTAEEFSVLQNRIFSALNSLNDPKAENILRRAYLCGHSERQIAKEMGYSVDMVRKIKAYGLDKIKL